jgi:isoamylase
VSEREWPLGGYVDASGARFRVFAPDAHAVVLCLRKGRDAPELRFVMTKQTDGSFALRLDAVEPGALYTYCAEGPYAPNEGLFFNSNLKLLDPYARKLACRPAQPADPSADPSAGPSTSPVTIPITDEGAEVHECLWGCVTEVPKDRCAASGNRPNRAWDETIIYEAHVRGMTMLHPELPKEQRGTFRGLSHPSVLDHLEQLGVTALELMPVFHIKHEPRLLAQGLANDWGYSPASFFAIEPSYASDKENPEGELSALVHACHVRGIEVILDVVYNHTGELDESYPAFSFRGLAARTYYRRDSARNASGCGNTLNLDAPEVRALILESLRFLRNQIGIDGVRFDLGAIVLGNGQLVREIEADVDLVGMKLIAEPWDAQSYGLGSLPESVFEWNDRFRDDVRKVFRGDAGMIGALASRYAGSSDLLRAGAHSGARSRSLNYVSAHDGFTLRDSVSFLHRHNEANGEQNRDGHAHEVSVNHGVEGSSPELESARLSHVRALLAMLYLSKGVPMLSHGDELFRTQLGNNNAYCQDGPLTWLRWDHADRHAYPHSLAAWCGALAKLRSVLQRNLSFYIAEAEASASASAGDCDPELRVAWRLPERSRDAPLEENDWAAARALVAHHTSMMLVFNPSKEAITVEVPERYTQVLLSSADGSVLVLGSTLREACSGTMRVAARSVSVLGIATLSR